METRKITELRANPLNPRGEVVEDDSLQELAASIRSHGVLQPILITPDGTIIAGHRRVRASEIAKVDSVPVVVRDLDETSQIQVMLIENLQRSSLTALQTARAYQTLCDRGLSIQQISLTIGYNKTSISRHLDLLKLPEGLHACFDGEQSIPLGGIRCLLELDESKRLAIGLQCKEKNWTIGRLRQVVARHSPNPLAEFSKNTLDRIYEKIEDGCYSLDSIAICGECGAPAFRNLTRDELVDHLEQLVREGRVEKRKQGGKKESQRGEMVDLYVPADTPTGTIDFTDRRRLAAGNEYAR